MFQILLRQRCLAAETMYYPRIRRAQVPLHLQQFIDRLDQMNHQRLSYFLRQACLTPEHFYLQIHRSICQLVQPSFAHGKYLGMEYYPLQAAYSTSHNILCY